MGKRIALTFGLVVVFVLAMRVFFVRAFLVPITHRPMPDFPAAIALIGGTLLSLFGINIVDRLAPVPKEEQGR